MPIPLTTRTRRAGFALVAAGLLATGATACDPPPPPPSFTVIAAETGADIDPGDGECANADGRCSLQAAVEEANALDTPTDITILPGTVAPVSLTVTDAIDLFGSETVLDLTDVSFTVEEGAKLLVTDVYMDSAEVHGTFATRRVALGEVSAGGAVDPVVQVGPTGRVMLTNTFVTAWDRPMAHNAGVLVLHSTSVQRVPDVNTVATITTEAGADTRIAATNFFGDFAPTCAGEAPTSFGYNLVANDSCGLTETGDRQDVDGDGVGLDQDSPRIDAIPVGTLQCGEGWTDDIDGEGTRPTDGNEDETLACDIGADEYSSTP